MGDRDDTPKGGAQPRNEYPPPALPAWEELRDSARYMQELQRQQDPEPTQSKRHSWRPNGGTKMVFGIILSALVTVAMVEGIPALISSDKQGAVKDAEQDVQIDRLQRDVTETKQEVKAIKGIVVRIEQKVDQ